MSQHPHLPLALFGVPMPASLRAPYRRGIAVVLAAAVLAVVPVSPAWAATDALSLAETIRLAVARSPQLGSQRAMVEAAREMAGPAGQLPDPKLKLGVENVPTEGPDAWSLTRDFMTMSRIGLMQEFPRAEKRELKSQRVLRDAERGAAAIEVATLAVRREAATAWLARRYSAEAERLVAEQIAEADLVVATAMSAYRAGKAPQAELIAAQTAVLELRNRATEASMQAKRARIALARYIGADADRPLGDAPDVARLPFDPARLSDIDAQPEIHLARAQESVAAAEADIARAAKLPDWSAEVSYAVRGPTYANMVSLMFSIDLPWSPGTRQEREYAAKLKEQDAAREMREDTLRMRAAEVEGMRAEWESARIQAERIRDDMLPLAAQRREAALAAYRGGTGTLAAVLDARRGELDARLALLQQEQAAAKAWAWLNFVLPVTEAS
jgi:outer membrane protein TolC